MIFAAGILTQSFVGDVALIGTVLGMFGTILKLLGDMKKAAREARSEREAEIRRVVGEAITTPPEKVNVGPQPFQVELKQEFVSVAEHKDDISECKRRIAALEAHRESDKKDLLDRIDSVPGRVIALLKDTKGLI